MNILYSWDPNSRSAHVYADYSLLSPYVSWQKCQQTPHDSGYIHCVR